jgi:hypothetical protein
MLGLLAPPGSTPWRVRSVLFLGVGGRLPPPHPPCLPAFSVPAGQARRAENCIVGVSIFARHWPATPLRSARLRVDGGVGVSLRAIGAPFCRAPGSSLHLGARLGGSSRSVPFSGSAVAAASPPSLPASLLSTSRAGPPCGELYRWRLDFRAPRAGNTPPLGAAAGGWGCGRVYNYEKDMLGEGEKVEPFC